MGRWNGWVGGIGEKSHDDHALDLSLLVRQHDFRDSNRGLPADASLPDARESRDEQVPLLFQYRRQSWVEASDSDPGWKALSHSTCPEGTPAPDPRT